MKRLKNTAILSLCLSLLFSSVPVSASETGQEYTSAEVTAADIPEEGESEVTAPTGDTDQADIATGGSEDGAAAAETETEDAAEEAAETETEDLAEAAEETVPESEDKSVIKDDAETADEVTDESAAANAADETAEEEAAVDTETAVDTGAADTTETAADGTAAEDAATAADGTAADAATAADGTAATVDAAAAEEAAADTAAVPEEAAVSGESKNAAAPALSSVAGSVEEKIAQMKLEVIDYLDEGFGDSQMLSSGGSRLLIDTYSPGSWGVLDSWLSDKKYMDFDIYISHYHNDHMGNVINILNDDKYKVNKLYLPDYGYMTGSNSYMQDYRSDCEDIFDTAIAKGVEIIQLAKNSVFTVGDVTAQVLWGTDYEDGSHDTDYINNNSLVTKFTCGNTRYLNAGDIEADTEDDILRARVDVAAEICKLSHHGGNSSNTRAFLNAVNAVYYYYNYCEDSPSRYSPAGTWSYGPTQSAKQIGNVASVRYNGDITYGVYDDVITQELERNYTTNTIYLYDPDDPEKLRGILTQDFNRATTKYIDQRAYGDYDFSTTKRENSYVEDGWFIGNGDTQYYYRDNEPVTGWLVDGDAKYYMDPDTGKKETGWLTVGSDTYFFDEYGRMQTGFVKVGTAVHHFDDEGRQTKTGWALIDGNRYYFGAYNKMAQGVYTIDGKKYLFDRNTGIMQIGVVRQGSSLYFTDDSGVLYPAGWTDYNGSRYYLDSNGRASTGWNKVSGNWYLMGSDGVMLTSWQRAGGIWYYLDDGGVMQTGWQQFGGRMYYLSGSGAMQTGWQKIDGAWYYMNGSGVMQTGWQKIGRMWYYLGADGVMQTGWQFINGRWYYMNAGGAMQTGWQKIDGKWYYMNAGGAMQTGWQRIGSVWYYMNDSGVMQTGWQLIGGKWYYFKSSGAWVR